MWFHDASYHHVICLFWKKKVTSQRRTLQKRAVFKKSGYKKPRRAAIGILEGKSNDDDGGEDEENVSLYMNSHIIIIP